MSPASAGRPSRKAAPHSHPLSYTPSPPCLDPGAHPPPTRPSHQGHPWCSPPADPTQSGLGWGGGRNARCWAHPMTVLSCVTRRLTTSHPEAHYLSRKQVTSPSLTALSSLRPSSPRHLCAKHLYARPPVLRGNHRVCPALQKGPGQHEALSLQTADSASLHGHLGTPSEIHIKLFFTREQRREGCASRAQRLWRQLRTAPDYESQRTKRTVARIRSRLSFPLTCKEVQSRVNTAAPPPPTTQAPLACSPPPLT